MTGNASYVARRGSQDIALVFATVTFEFPAHSGTGVHETADAAYGDARSFGSVLHHSDTRLIHEH